MSGENDHPGVEYRFNRQYAQFRFRHRHNEARQVSPNASGTQYEWLKIVVDILGAAHSSDDTSSVCTVALEPMKDHPGSRHILISSNADGSN